MSLCGLYWTAPHLLPCSTFALNRERAVDFLNQLERLYVTDGYACWHPEVRYRIRVVCARPYHALFAHNMLIRWAGGGTGMGRVGGRVSRGGSRLCVTRGWPHAAATHALQGRAGPQDRQVWI